jgi:hypothetical protein
MKDDGGRIARLQIADLARSMLAGDLLFMEGSRSISAIRFMAKIENDPDILPLVRIDIASDTLPFGKINNLWNRNALAELQSEIDRKESWARDLARPHCENLVRRFGQPT